MLQIPVNSVDFHDPDAVILRGDARERLAELADSSVHAVMSSPPFWSLRDYGHEGQIGVEASPFGWTRNLVEVYAQCRRILRPDGVMFVEIGDVYQDKKLLGLPWRLAFALCDDGWILRQEIIWHKPNVMPESVSDRPTTAHTRIFLFAKTNSYYWNKDAILEPHQPDGRKQTMIAANGAGKTTHTNYANRAKAERWPGSGRNARSVLTIPTESNADAHFATWPQKLVEWMIKASTADVVCGVCDGAWAFDKAQTGWFPICQCKPDAPATPPQRPAVILDPFMGSGTTALVARRLGRHSVGVEINPVYIRLAARKLGQQSLFA